MMFRYFLYSMAIFFTLAGMAQPEGKKIDSLKSVYKHSAADSTRLDALNALIWPLYADSKPDSGVKYAMIAIDLAKRTNNLRKLMITYRRVGICYTTLGNYKQGLFYHQLSLDLAKQLKDTSSIGIAYGNIGVVYLDLGDFTRALDYSLKSIRLKEQVKSFGSINTNYYNIGLIRKNMGDYEHALRDMDSSVKYALIIKDERSLGKAYNGKGMVYNAWSKPGLAKQFYILASVTNEKSGNDYNMSENYNSLGNLFFKAENYDSADYYFKKSLAASTKVQYASGIAFSLADLALDAITRKDYKEAIAYAHRSIKADPDNIDNEGFCDGILSDAYRGMKDYESALLYTDKQNVIKDSLDNINKNKDIIRLQLQYDYEKMMTADSIKFNDQEKISNAKIEAAGAKLNQEKTFRYALIFGLVGLLVFLYIIFSRLRLINSQKNTIELQRNEMEHQKELVEEKQKEIVDSINYARRIQYALLAHDDLLRTNLRDFFILFKPKDIVSGDFYWATRKDDRFYMAICDCTGHGVPGAFMSLLNISFLNEAVNEHGIKAPNDILDHVRKRLIENISQDGGQDGMDAILVCFAPGGVTYAAANNKPLIVRNGSCITLPADKMPVGKGERVAPFTLYEMPVQSGDRVYLLTDGYPDQFGGPGGKKFKYRQLEQLLLSVSHLPFDEQSAILHDRLEAWKGGLEQVDDILVTGISIS